MALVSAIIFGAGSAIGEEKEVSLHAGVKPGMGILEVVQTEADAGNKLVNASPNAGGKEVTADNAESIELPFNRLYYYGKVAGGDSDSHANFFFNDERILTKVEYFIRSSKGKARKLYNQIEEALRNNYGKPDTTAAARKKLDLGSDVSKVSSYRNIASIGDYSQWIVTQPDGSKVLIEHVFQQASSNKEFNFVNYVLLDTDVETEADRMEKDL